MRSRARFASSSMPNSAVSIQSQTAQFLVIRFQAGPLCSQRPRSHLLLLSSLAADHGTKSMNHKRGLDLNLLLQLSRYCCQLLPSSPAASAVPEFFFFLSPGASSLFWPRWPLPLIGSTFLSGSGCAGANAGTRTFWSLFPRLGDKQAGKRVRWHLPDCASDIR